MTRDKGHIDLTLPFEPKWFLRLKYRAVHPLADTVWYYFTTGGVGVPHTPIVPLEGWAGESTLIFEKIDTLSHTDYNGEARFEFDDGNGPKMFYGKWAKKGGEHVVIVDL